MAKISKARKTSEVPTKIVTIGVLTKPSADERHSPQMQVIHDQLFAAFLYRRALVDIENTRRAAFHELRRSLAPRLNELETEVDRLETEMAELRKGLKRKKDRGLPEQKDRIEAINKVKQARNLLYPEIQREQDAIQENHFAELNECFREQKTKRLEEAAKKKGVPKLGPNDPVRRAVMAKLDEDMAKMGPKAAAWLRKRQIDLEAEAAARAARSETLCSPGTYLAVEEAIQRAKSDAPAGKLRQKPWDYTGRIGVQLTGDRGLTIERALSGKDEKLKIEIDESVPLRRGKSDVFVPSYSRPVDLHAEQRAARAAYYTKHPERRPYRRLVTTRLKLSGHKKDAVFLDLRGVLHRPLPPDGILKWAFLNVDRIGYDVVYELQLIVESKTFAVVRRGAGSAKRLAVNFGWRVLEDGDVRVATTWDGKKAGHVLLTSYMLSGESQAEHLLAHSDMHFDAARDQVISWLGELSPSDSKELLPLLRATLPARLRTEMKSKQQILTYMGRWRSHERLMKVANVLSKLYLDEDQDKAKRLCADWKQHRLGATLDLFASFEEVAKWLGRRLPSANARLAFYLELWRQKDRHLVNWARHGKTKLLRHRREIYRRTAFQWAQEYGQVATEKWDKRETAKVPKYENDHRVPQEVNANAIRQIAGIYKFTRALDEKLGPDHLKTTANDISREHFGCGGMAVVINPTKPSLSPTEKLECDRCHSIFDQDTNAARHLWNRAFGDGGAGKASPKKRERSGAGKTPAPSRKRRSSRKGAETSDLAAE